MLFKNQVSGSDFLTATFDCRQYKKDTPRNLRPMVEAGGRINLTTSMTEEEIPAELKEFARKSSKNERLYLTFKVFPKNCRIFTASARQVAFPENEVLDGGRFEIRIDYSIKHGTGTELNGCYANSIQIIKRADVPFDAIEGGDDDFMSVAPVSSVITPDTEHEPERIQIKEQPQTATKLPF